ncbi:MAG: ribosome maturation factor [Flaviaesturariibacter sp.]|nr:ribosome maturation factor [Flaviaesturariibacter sp.]
MQTETLVETLTGMINDLLADPKHFLVEVRIKPVNNVKVFIDSDEGIALAELIRYNRQLNKQLEENPIFPGGDYSLEFSSPGLDEPLKLHRQYKKNIGRYVDITMLDASKKEGKLLDTTEDGIIVETEMGKGKKKEIKQETILFNDIKSTKIQIKF